MRAFLGEAEWWPPASYQNRPLGVARCGQAGQRIVILAGDQLPSYDHQDAAEDLLRGPRSLGRMSGDGVAAMPRRVDRRVKSRGHRVALTVLEGALRGLPEVEEAVMRPRLVDGTATLAAGRVPRITRPIMPTHR